MIVSALLQPCYNLLHATCCTVLYSTVHFIMNDNLCPSNSVDAKFSHSGKDSLLVINPDYQTFTRDTKQVQFFVTRHASLRDSALKIRTSHDGALPVKLTSNIPYSRVDLSHLTLFDEGFYESELVLSLNEILTNSGCDSSFGTQYKRFFNEYLNMGDEISIGYSLARLQYYGMLVLYMQQMFMFA